MLLSLVVTFTKKGAVLHLPLNEKKIMGFISKLFGKDRKRKAGQSSFDAQYADGIIKAVMRGDASAVNELLEKGADINSVEGGAPNFSPLMWAAALGDIRMLKLLLDRGADPNLMNGRGVTALLPAAKEGHLDAVRLLLDKGANVHSEAQGVSPLSAAASYGHLEVVKILLDTGARDNNGKAFEGASQLGHQEIVNLLKREGGR